MKKLPDLKANLPQRVDDATTLIDVKIEGVTTVYVYQVSSGIAAIDTGQLNNLVSSKVCASPSIRGSINNGAAYRYEYWDTEPEKKLLAAFDIKSCQ